MAPRKVSKSMANIRNFVTNAAAKSMANAITPFSPSKMLADSVTMRKLRDMTSMKLHQFHKTIEVNGVISTDDKRNAILAVCDMLEVIMDGDVSMDNMEKREINLNFANILTSYPLDEYERLNAVADGVKQALEGKSSTVDNTEHKGAILIDTEQTSLSADDITHTAVVSDDMQQTRSECQWGKKMVTSMDSETNTAIDSHHMLSAYPLPEQN